MKRFVRVCVRECGALEESPMSIDPAFGRDRKRPAECAYIQGNVTKKKASPKLVVVPPSDGSGASNDVTPATASANAMKKERIPPLIVKDLLEEEFAEFNALANTDKLEASFNFLKGNYTKISCNTRDGFEAVVGRLNQLKREFYSQDFPGEKPFQVILKGLCFGTPEAVEKWLVTTELPRPSSIRLMESNVAAKASFKNFVVAFNKGQTTLEQLQKVKRIQSVNVRWERYFPVRDEVTQCKNCFRFGHGQNHCSMKTRCMKCGGEHHAKQCFVELENNRRCANCEGNHSPLNHNCLARRDFLEKRDGKYHQKAATRYNLAPPPAESAWNSRLSWIPPQNTIPGYHKKSCHQLACNRNNLHRYHRHH